MQFVDERDDLTVGGVNLGENGLEPFLKLAAEFGPGNERADVKSDELLALEALSNVAGHDALGEALNHSGLAHARFANQDRVVLGAAGKNLADTSDLGVTADDRVELAVLGALGEIDAELLESAFGLFLLRLRVHYLPPYSMRRSGFQRTTSVERRTR